MNKHMMFILGVILMVAGAFCVIGASHNLNALPGHDIPNLEQDNAELNELLITKNTTIETLEKELQFKNSLISSNERIIKFMQQTDNHRVNLINILRSRLNEPSTDILYPFVEGTTSETP